MSKKTYKDLKNEIEELKNTLDARNGRIAFLSLATVQQESKIQEYKGMIKTLEARLSNIHTKALAISNNVKHGTDYHPNDVAFKKTYKIPLRTENMNLDYSYCLNDDTCIHRRGCKRWIGNYTDNQIKELYESSRFIAEIDDTKCIPNLSDVDCENDYGLLDRFRSSVG